MIRTLDFGRQQKYSRRRFAKSTALVAATFPFVTTARADTERRYRTALIGSGWWGMNILTEAMSARRSQVVALCDVDPHAIGHATERVKELSGDQPKGYRDYRELLEREKPDVCIIATPDHWHALQTIACVHAGSHVFVEKPTGHTVNESRAMVRAARASDRTIQVGLHRRIGPHHVSGMKFLKGGGAGKVGMVRLIIANGGGRELPSGNSEPPEAMDWDMYCGPAPLRPFNRKIHPGGWRNFLDFANGTLGDWGVHWLDQVLLWTEEKYPRRIYSTGGRPIKGPPILTEKEQTTDAPDSQVATFEFESFTAVWEHRQFGENHAEKHNIGAYFYGTKGVFHMGWRDGWTFYPAKDGEPVQHEDSQLQEPDGHNLKLLWANFIESLDRKQIPIANIEVAHRSSVLPLLGMISMKSGRSLQWDGVQEKIVGDEEANRLLSRPYRGPWVYPS